jgi:hypothetical protein
MSSRSIPVAIEFSCERCFRHYRLKDKFAGQQYTCKQCGVVFTVPGGVDGAAGKPRELQIREALGVRLVQLRLFSGATLPPTLDAQAVAEAERLVKGVLPDEILAVLANGDDELYDQRGIDLSRIQEYVDEAKSSHCPKELVPIGRDEHLLFCIGRTLSRTATPGITTFDDADGSTSYLSLLEWLDQIIEIRRESLRHLDPALAELMPTGQDLSNYRPALI